ncbi:fluoride efflux transporter CrcB [Aquibacillus albus]|uniref:Fluoride-specific ion channel FluC n=1 Tax=Aquibacillus albus TaxID=1168171 RepID=A0ABS2MYW7_9BACI|nr:CrcB protein [Aquibacillus albus]
MAFFFVAFGGLIGSIARYIISSHWNSKKYPFGTFIVNSSGSILLGILVALRINNPENDWVSLLVGIGFCGSFTTFSTFSKETIEMLFSKNYKQAFLYTFSSFAVSIFFVSIILVLTGAIS